MWYKKFALLDILNKAEDWLQERIPLFFGDDEDWDSEEWNDLEVTYAFPKVQRLWIPFFADEDNSYRIFLHKIFPIPPGETSLWHNHPWPSAMKIIEGSYDMDIGTIKQDKVPEVAMSLHMTKGSCYSMPYPLEWHNVKPCNEEPVYSLMVINRPFNALELDNLGLNISYSFRPKQKQSRLSPDVRKDLIRFWSKIYKRPSMGGL